MSRPDEGRIHAWLDGELDAAESARVEMLVREDPEWGAAAANARGFIAASARIVGALDHVPPHVIPKPAPSPTNVTPLGAARTSHSASRGAPWWAMRAAALLAIVVGTAVVVRRTPEGTGVGNVRDQAKTTMAGEPTSTVAEPTAAATPQAIASPAGEQKKDKGGAGQPPEALAAPASVAANEIDGQLRRTLGDAPQKLSVRNAPAAAPAPLVASALRDRLDERRTAFADSAGTTAAMGRVQAEQTSSDLKKDAAPALKANVAGLSSVVTTGMASGAGANLGANASTRTTAAFSSSADVSDPVTAKLLEACYLEPPGSGTTSILHRVSRIDDTTALTGASLGSRSEVSAARARQAPAAIAASASAAAARLKVRGDTLFVASTATATRIALKVNCQPPE